MSHQPNAAAGGGVLEPPVQPERRHAVLLQKLYTANATVLLLHQVEAAYWEEWELFGLPGGVQLFVALNLPIVWGVLRGARAMSLGARTSAAWSSALAAAGVFAVVFHTAHLAAGDEAFRTPMSISLLATTALLSAAQFATLVAVQRGDRRSTPPSHVERAASRDTLSVQ